MEIDLSKLIAGDTVKFRAGGQAEISESVLHTHMDAHGDHYKLTFMSGYTTMYGHQGCSCANNNGMHPFDIVEIIPAPFNWDTVKAGMAFMCGQAKELGFYIGYSPKNSDIIYLETGSIISNYKREYLTRAPDEDITPTKQTEGE